MNKRNSGYTLIELVIAIVFVAVAIGIVTVIGLVGWVLIHFIAKVW